MASTVFDWSPTEWDNLKSLLNKAQQLVEGKESPRKLSSIERTKLRITLKTLEGYNT